MENLDQELKVSNDAFLKALFPPLDFIKEATTPVFANMLVYGQQSFGKSETVKWIVKEAEDYYGKDKVNATLSENLGVLIREGVRKAKKKPIQILIGEDVTLHEPTLEEVDDFFKIRHVAEGRGLKQGYILTILTIHDFHSLEKRFRTFFQFLVLANAPTNKYDHNILKTYLSPRIMRQLEFMQKKKHFNHSAKAYKAFWFLGDSGFFKSEIVPIKIHTLEEERIPTYSRLLPEEARAIQRDIAKYHARELDIRYRGEAISKLEAWKKELRGEKKVPVPVKPLPRKVRRPVEEEEEGMEMYEMDEEFYE